MNVLHICANPKPTEESASKQLAAKFFTTLVTNSPDIEVTNIDLYAEQPPAYTYEEYRNFWFPHNIEGYVPTKEEEAASEYAIDQASKLLHADALVLTLPLWNFTAPGIMHTWLDHILSPGLLYDLNGKEVKLKHKIKRVIVLVASGEAFKEGDSRDALSPQLINVFSGIGIEEVSFAWADGQDGTTYSDAAQRKEMALEAAEELAEEIAEEIGSPASA